MNTNRKPKSKLSLLANSRSRALLAIVVFALVGAAALIYSHAQVISKAQCTQACVGIAAASNDNKKYWEVGIDGGVFSFGGANFYGSVPGKGVYVRNVIGIAANPAKTGYWIATQTGNVYNFGSAPSPAKPSIASYGATVNNIVGIAAAPSGTGYYLVGSDGGVFAFDAPFHGSMGGQPLAKPMVGIAIRPQGGYWLVAADGGVFAYGGAPFQGAMAGKPLNKPIVAMESTPSGNGYWLVAADGGIFSFGDAAFHGSVGGVQLNGPVNSISRTTSGNGYWLSASDGGVYAFGDAQYSGNALVPSPPPPPPVAKPPSPVASTPVKPSTPPGAPGEVVCKPGDLVLRNPAGKVTSCLPHGGATPNPPPPTPVVPPRPNPAPAPGVVTSPPRPPLNCDSNPTLRQGSTGECVKVVQRYLKINDDGNFGSGTKSSVMNFQKTRGLSADGIVGPKTWAALRGNAPPLVTVLPPPADSIGSGLAPSHPVPTYGFRMENPIYAPSGPDRIKFTKFGTQWTLDGRFLYFKDCSVYADYEAKNSNNNIYNKLYEYRLSIHDDGCAIPLSRYAGTSFGDIKRIWVKTN